MRLTSKQREELAVIKHFIPSNQSFDEITDANIEQFFAWSDRGIGGDDVKQQAMKTNSGLSALYWGKNRRDLQITSYLEDWGHTCTSVDFVDEPREVVVFLSKAMQKPGLLTTWKLFNEPDDLSTAEQDSLASVFAPYGFSDTSPLPAA